VKYGDMAGEGLMGFLGIADPLSEKATPATGIGALLGMLGPAAVMGGLRRVKNPIKAYHGTPHDFDKFDLSRIGTGEGAQSYGQGLYFAESPEVAAKYRALAKAPSHRGNVIEADLRRSYEQTGDWAASVERHLASYYAPAKQKEAYRQQLLKQGPPTRTDDGRMYEVNLHVAPDELLDWDAPLGAQPRMAEVGKKLRIGADYGNPDAAPGQHLLKTATRESRHFPDSPTGESVLHNKFGIPGLRYLDGVSRKAGEGSRNYVIWDEDVIEILRKYGVLPPIGAVAANEAMKSADGQLPANLQGDNVRVSPVMSGVKR